MKIKKEDVLFIRRGHRSCFFDIVERSTPTSIMTSALRRRRTTRGSTRKYWSHAADSSEDLSLQQLSNPIQPNSLIYPSLSYRRLSLRRSKSARPRPRKASIATPTRVPNDVLAAYKASCMRKTRRHSPLNVGELQITSTHIHFTAHYLNSAPGDAHISLPLDGVIHIRRACYRRVLPHGVLIRCQGFPDYLMVLANRQQQADVLDVLSNALRNTQEMVGSLPSQSDHLFEFDSGSSGNRDSSPEREPSVERSASTKLDRDHNKYADAGKEECNPVPPHKETCSCNCKSNAAPPEADNVRLQSLKTVTLATKTVSQGKLLLSDGPEQFKNLANDLLGKDTNVHEGFIESSLLFVSAVLLLFVTLGVLLALNSLRTRVITVTNLISAQK